MVLPALSRLNKESRPRIVKVNDHVLFITYKTSENQFQILVNRGGQGSNFISARAKTKTRYKR